MGVPAVSPSQWTKASLGIGLFALGCFAAIFLTADWRTPLGLWINYQGGWVVMGLAAAALGVGLMARRKGEHSRANGIALCLSGVLLGLNLFGWIGVTLLGD